MINAPCSGIYTLSQKKKQPKKQKKTPIKIFWEEGGVITIVFIDEISQVLTMNCKKDNTTHFCLYWYKQNEVTLG